MAIYETIFLVLLFLFSFSVGDAALFTLISLLMITIGGSTGVILGNAVADISRRGTYYVVSHFQFRIIFRGM